MRRPSCARPGGNAEIVGQFIMEFGFAMPPKQEVRNWAIFEGDRQRSSVRWWSGSSGARGTIMAWRRRSQPASR